MGVTPLGEAVVGAGVVDYAGAVAGGGAGAVARSAGQFADGTHRTHNIDVTGREW